MKITYFIITFLFFRLSVNAQQQEFIDKGKIEFERTTNLYKRLEQDDEDGNSSIIEALKKELPEYKTSYFNLYFDGNKTLYQPGRVVETVKKVPEWMQGPAEDNIVYSDLSSNTFSSQKSVFETTYNIQDSLRNAQWKITSDKRTIAGFECRKATTTIMDSVYVFAFYTDQIVPRGGPESFAGLPGMILGIAIPRMHTTWFATKLEVTEPNTNVILPPKKGKKTNVSSLKTTLQNSLKQWGKYGQRYTWTIMI
ncbi:GLPGLI family protein [Segetibacter koreensis]|uniref:GLPGLI family protein n=1 Tax=Segetibacter koreensis TaxID=398037 RepID=UPI00037AF4D7|nr:GLPGLI family protein [Segetibacter koreensis]